MRKQIWNEIFSEKASEIKILMAFKANHWSMKQIHLTDNMETLTCQWKRHPDDGIGTIQGLTHQLKKVIPSMMSCLGDSNIAKTSFDWRHTKNGPGYKLKTDRKGDGKRDI